METTTTKTCGGNLPLLLLPEDVLIQNILVCLPVKSLLRFKSVCKSWLQLIQTPFFIHLHTTTTTTTSSSKFGAFIIQTIEPSLENYEDDIKLYKLSSGDADGGGGEDDDNKDDDDDDEKKKMVFKVDDLGFFPFYKDTQLSDTLGMVGSCNGIICLHDPVLMDASKGGRSKQHYLNLRDVCLWNPATRQFRILPKSIPIEEKQDYMGNWLEDFIAFGFDVKTKDYKVLRITPWEVSEEGGGCMCRVQVYSLSTDSWRLLEGINSLPCLPNQSLSPNSGIYLNGSYFFAERVGSYNESSSSLVWMLLSFDFTKEIFTTSIQLPSFNSIVSSYLGDKLAVFTQPVFTKPQYPVVDVDDGYEYYDIWVLNEQHDSSAVVKKESWTKLHSFRIERTSDSIKPRCISNNGEFALISTGRTDNVYDGGFWRNKLQLINLITKEAIKDFTIGRWKWNQCRADVYKESLVSIMGGGNVLLRWQLPTHGTTYKLNLVLDAPFIGPYFRFGIGLCLTSDTGGCIGVRSLKRYVSDAEEGEAMAMLEAIKWAKKLELSPIIIESNSKNVVSFFMEDDDDDANNLTNWSSKAQSLLREAKLLLNSSEIAISFKYCSRSCNYVADIAAKLGREGSCKDWTANFPGEMVMSLSKDLGLENRN